MNSTAFRVAKENQVNKVIVDLRQCPIVYAFVHPSKLMALVTLRTDLNSSKHKSFGKVRLKGFNGR